MPFRDVRIAIRLLLKSPGFTAAAVLMLALGIGATTAVFSVVEGVLLRPLPFPHSEDLVSLPRTFRPTRATRRASKVLADISKRITNCPAWANRRR
jgi:hypothetical protein